VGVSDVLVLPPDLVRAQIEAVVTDIGCHAAKTGMLGSADVVRAVSEAAREHKISPLVVDPVMVAKSGAALLDDAGVNALVQHLMPLATVITPNLCEAGRLVGRRIASVKDMVQAAEEIGKLGPGAVLVKGGHLLDEPADVLWQSGEADVAVLRAPRLPSHNTHGTGCILSAAITAGLARGLSVLEAVRKAKLFVTEAVRYGLPYGAGSGPANVLAAGRMLPSD
jgi:hydroxymethylpyrimidine/phosphomethylpyrimidine kinase